MRLLAAALLLATGACVPAHPPTTAPSATPPAATALAGDVQIAYPQLGATIYAEALLVAGTAAGIVDERLAVRLEAPDGNIIAQATVDTTGGHWQAEVLHQYSGDPIEVTVVATPLDAALDSVYTAVTIVMAGIQHRPAELANSIAQPAPGSTVGGDVIRVEGSSTALLHNMFVLSLVGPNGTVIDEQRVTVHNPYVVDLMPWTADLSTQGYTGPAQIRAYTQTASFAVTELDSTAITVIQEAG